MANLRFKKRYIPLILIVALFVSYKLGFMSLRKSESSQRKELAEMGVTEVEFGTYTAWTRTMHYTHVGDTSLPLVLMVHGSPGSSSDMLKFLGDRRLLEKAQVVAVDRPGFGYSEYGRSEESLELQAYDFRQILEKYGRRGSILVGHSYGGPVICRSAIDIPERVQGLVIVAGSIDPDLEPENWWQKPLNWWLVRSFIPPSFRVSNQEILALKDELILMKPKLEGIRCPVTVVQGLADDLVPAGNAFYAQQMMVNCPQLSLDTLAGKDHFIMWSMHDHIVDQILPMLEELERNPVDIPGGYW